MVVKKTKQFPSVLKGETKFNLDERTKQSFAKLVQRNKKKQPLISDYFQSNQKPLFLLPQPRSTDHFTQRIFFFIFFKSPKQH